MHASHSLKANKTWYFDNCPLFQVLDKAAQQELADHMQVRNVRKHQLIMQPDSQQGFVYFLRKGLVKVGSYTEKGEEDYKYLVKSGELFGEMVLVEGNNPNEIAISVTDSIVCMLEASRFQRLMFRHPSLNQALMQLIGHRLQRLEQRLASIMYKSSRDRIIEFLRQYVEETGQENGSVLQAANVLTHTDIAKLTSTSRQSVNAVFNELRNAHLIDYDKSYLWVPKQLLSGLGQQVAIA
jgi:CRP/FNR family transcriptional regulator, cyclic AMP receptor protein